MKVFLFPVRALRLLLLLVVILTAQNTELRAQAQPEPTLSIQGILKKSNGVAVEDGNYNITFKLYKMPTGGTAIWTEVQSDVEVSSGIYSAVLGNTTSLGGLPFNELYYLGVTIGSGELTPRILLTSAPYALSLIGTTNQFPSSGKVLADSIQVKGAVLARGGAPGLNGASKNGYAFTGNSGDKDSGVFSTGDGKVSLYANNTEILAVSPGNVTVTGNVNTSNLDLATGGSVNYNGLNDWRLVEVDNFGSISDPEGWQYSDADAGSGSNAWKNALAGPATLTNYGDFVGTALAPSDNDQVLKKQFSPAGTYTQIKVVFKYIAIGNWDLDDISSGGWAAFSNVGSGGGNIRVGWDYHPQFMSGSYNYDNDTFRAASSFALVPANTSDQWRTGQMVGAHNGPFWVYFGYANDEDENNENFAVGAIEIWVK